MSSLHQTMLVALAASAVANSANAADAGAPRYPGPAPKAAPAYAAAQPLLASRAIHNGSLMAVYVLGPKIEIRYEQPRQGLADIGVTPGTVLVQATWVTPQKIEGIAFIFPAWGCPPFPYPVAGSVDRYSVLTLSGAAPQLDYGCRVVGYNWNSQHAYLRFDQAAAP
jgi:hypothetical protein